MPLLLFLFLGSFAFFLHGVSPSLYGGDSGELIASGTCLGVPHAPGYPLFTLLAKSATVLFPFGNMAFRVNLLSCLIASLVLVLAFRFFKDICPPMKGDAAAWGGTLLLGLSPLFQEQARVSEVFILNLLLLVLLLTSLWKTKTDSHGSQWMLLACFIFGLGLGNHHTIVFSLPLFLVALWRRPVSWRVVSSGLFFFLLGGSVTLILLIRAHAGPPVNFGDPETWPRFWAVITRKEFGSLSLHPAAVPFRDIHITAQQVLRFSERLITQIGVSGLLLVGMGSLFGIKRPLAWAALYGLLVCGLGFELFSNLSPTSDIGQWRLERFLLIPIFSASALAVLAFQKGLARPFLRWGMVFLLCGVVVESMGAKRQAASFRTNFVYRDFALSLFRGAPPGARLVIDRTLFDEPTSSLLVATHVEGKRPDIQFFYRPGTLFNAVYGKDVLDLSWPDRFRRQAEVEKQTLAGGREPIRALAFDRTHVPFDQPIMDGFLYRPSGEAPADNTLSHAREFIFNRERHGTPGGDYPRRLMSVHFPYFFAKNELERGHLEQAQRWLRSADLIGPDMAWLAANEGGIYSSAGLLADAKNCYERAVRLDPTYYLGHYGLGYLWLKEGNASKAVAAYQEAVRMNPEFADSYYMLGAAFFMGGHAPSAVEPWKKYLRLEPNGAQAPAVRRELKKLLAG